MLTLWKQVLLPPHNPPEKTQPNNNQQSLPSNTKTISTIRQKKQQTSQVVSPHLWNAPRATFTNRLWAGIPFIVGCVCNFLGKKNNQNIHPQTFPKRVKAPTLQHLAFSLAMKGRRGAFPTGFTRGNRAVSLWALLGCWVCLRFLEGKNVFLALFWAWNIVDRGNLFFVVVATFLLETGGVCWDFKDFFVYKVVFWSFFLQKMVSSYWWM